MRKIIAVALLAAAVAAPAFAAETAAKASPKSAAAKPFGYKPGHKKADMMEDECDTRHGMSGRRGHGMADQGMPGMGMMGMSGMGDPYGYGMKGGQGMGMMMGPDMHMLDALSLSEEQQAKISKLSDELKHNNWATQGMINDETAKLRDLYQADKRDPAAIGKEYQKVFELKRQMIEAYLEMENRIEEILTPEQRAQMKEARSKMRRMYGNPMR